MGQGKKDVAISSLVCSIRSGSLDTGTTTSVVQMEQPGLSSAELHRATYTWWKCKWKCKWKLWCYAGLESKTPCLTTEPSPSSTTFLTLRPSHNSSFSTSVLAY